MEVGSPDNLFFLFGYPPLIVPRETLKGVLFHVKHSRVCSTWNTHDTLTV